MTGQLVFRQEPGERPARFVWRLEAGTRLFFQDVRRFGRLWAILPAVEEDFFASRGMGPEPFGPEFTPAYLRGALRGGRAPLKSFLIDQRRIAGVGNIYADEALFRARLHPLRAAGSVGPREALRLHAAVLETLQAGIDHEGSSIESFIDPAGRRGSFQEILNVYQRTGEACRVCGTTIERVVLGGRGTHYCPRCQPRRGGMAAGSRRRIGETAPPRSARPVGWKAPGR
jgi:formamidopyrimidine-DNA glycosylase